VVRRQKIARIPIEMQPPQFWTSRIRLRQSLEEELDMLDDQHRGKNTWNSTFVAGLLERDVLLWLFWQMYTPGRLPNGPLV